MAVSQTTRNGICHIFAVLISTGILLLFGLLTKYPIYIPHYATKDKVADAQQVVNFLTIIVAACLVLFMQYCFSLTNEAETAADLRMNLLTLPRLQTHAHAQNSSLGSLLYSMYKNASLRTIVLFYVTFIVVLGGISSVLGFIFVLDTTRATTGVLSKDTFSIPLSADVPPSTDQCSTSLSEGTCVYDIAMTALSSQLITHTPYTMGGVTFSPPNGTRGVPYGALKYFAASVNGSLFPDEKQQYCLPALNHQLVSCTEDPSSGGYGTSRVYYDVKDDVKTFNNKTVYEVTFDPDYYYREVYTATDIDSGTMTVAQTSDPAEKDTTIVTAQGPYANTLRSLMGNTDSQSYYSTAICSMYDLKDTAHSSWLWTSLDLNNGIITMDVSTDPCRKEMETAYFKGITGFDPLPLAIEATTTILGGVDGYSKLINYNSFNSSFSQLTLEQAEAYAQEHDMNLLESLLSQLYAIVQTSWTALDNATITQSHASTTNILQRNFPHNFIIKTFWSPTTYIAVVLAALIWICSVWQALRCLIAIRRLGKETHGWQLLEPLDLIAYSALAAGDLGPHVATSEARMAALREKDGIILKEYDKKTLGTLSPSTSRATAPSTLVAPMSPTNTAKEEEALVAREIEKDGRGSSST
ncbi:hypothetical protein LTR67_004463 [Exophiala xenobiotica]